MSKLNKLYRLSINEQNQKELRLQIFLLHQIEFLSGFLFELFSKQNMLEINNGVFNSSKPFLLKKYELEEYLLTKDVKKNLNNSLIKSVFYNATNNKANGNYSSYAQEFFKGWSINDIFANEEESLFSPIFDLEYENSQEEIFIDRIKLNSIFSKLFEVSFNSPLGELQELTKEYETRAKFQKMDGLLSISNFFETPEPWDTLSKINSKDIKFIPHKILNNEKTLESIFNNLFKNLKYITETYDRFSIIYKQSESFLKIVEEAIEQIKSKEETERSDCIKLNNLEKEIKNITDVLNKRKVDGSSFNNINYQQLRLSTLLTKFEKFDVDSIVFQEIQDRLEKFRKKINRDKKSNIDYLLNLYSKQKISLELIRKNSKLLEDKIRNKNFISEWSKLYKLENTHLKNAKELFYKTFDIKPLLNESCQLKTPDKYSLLKDNLPNILDAILQLSIKKKDFKEFDEEEANNLYLKKLNEEVLFSEEAKKKREEEAKLLKKLNGILSSYVWPELKFDLYCYNNQMLFARNYNLIYDYINKNKDYVELFNKFAILESKEILRITKEKIFSYLEEYETKLYKGK